MIKFVLSFLLFEDCLIKRILEVGNKSYKIENYKDKFVQCKDKIGNFCAKLLGIEKEIVLEGYENFYILDNYGLYFIDNSKKLFPKIYEENEKFLSGKSENKNNNNEKSNLNQQSIVQLNNTNSNLKQANQTFLHNDKKIDNLDNLVSNTLQGQQIYYQDEKLEQHNLQLQQVQNNQSDINQQQNTSLGYGFKKNSYNEFANFNSNCYQGLNQQYQQDFNQFKFQQQIVGLDNNLIQNNTSNMGSTFNLNNTNNNKFFQNQFEQQQTFEYIGQKNNSADLESFCDLVKNGYNKISLAYYGFCEKTYQKYLGKNVSCSVLLFEDEEFKKSLGNLKFLVVDFCEKYIGKIKDLKGLEYFLNRCFLNDFSDENVDTIYLIFGPVFWINLFIEINDLFCKSFYNKQIKCLFDKKKFLNMDDFLNNFYLEKLEKYFTKKDYFDENNNFYVVDGEGKTIYIDSESEKVRQNRLFIISNSGIPKAIDKNEEDFFKGLVKKKQEELNLKINKLFSGSSNNEKDDRNYYSCDNTNVVYYNTIKDILNKYILAFFECKFDYILKDKSVFSDIFSKINNSLNFKEKESVLALDCGHAKNIIENCKNIVSYEQNTNLGNLYENQRNIMSKIFYDVGAPCIIQYILPALISIDYTGKDNYLEKIEIFKTVKGSTEQTSFTDWSLENNKVYSVLQLDLFERIPKATYEKIDFMSKYRLHFGLISPNKCGDKNDFKKDDVASSFNKLLYSSSENYDKISLELKKSFCKSFFNQVDEINKYLRSPSQHCNFLFIAKSGKFFDKKSEEEYLNNVINNPEGFSFDKMNKFCSCFNALNEAGHYYCFYYSDLIPAPIASDICINGVNEKDCKCLFWSIVLEYLFIGSKPALVDINIIKLPQIMLDFFLCQSFPVSQEEYNPIGRINKSIKDQIKDQYGFYFLSRDGTQKIRFDKNINLGKGTKYGYVLKKTFILKDEKRIYRDENDKYENKNENDAIFVEEKFPEALIDNSGRYFQKCFDSKDIKYSNGKETIDIKEIIRKFYEEKDFKSISHTIFTDEVDIYSSYKEKKIT
jgi:hypothetical protein